MTVAKHTPGPWLLSAGWRPTPSVVDHQNVYAPSKIGVVAKVVMAGQDGDYSAERAANVRLIAAAPDLLAALREIETICTESASECRKRMGTRVGNSLTVARAAIAKATGGALKDSLNSTRQA